MRFMNPGISSPGRIMALSRSTFQPSWVSLWHNAVDHLGPLGGPVLKNRHPRRTTHTPRVWPLAGSSELAGKVLFWRFIRWR